LIIARIPGLVTLGGSEGALLRVVIVSLLVGVLYLAAVVVLHGGFAPLRQISLLLKDVMSKTSVTAESPLPEIAHAGTP
jgi:hypothetical protein